MRPVDPRLLVAAPEARRPIRWLSVAGLAQGAMSVAAGFAVAALVVSVVKGTSLLGPGLTVLVVFALRATLAYAVERAAAAAAVTISATLRRRLLSSWLTRPVEQTPDPDSGTTLAAHGVAAVETYVTRYLPALVQAAVLPVLAVAVLAVVDWPSALVVVLSLPLLPIFAALIGRTTQDATQRRWRRLRDLSGHFLDVVRGLPTLVAYGRGMRQVTSIATVSERLRVETMATLRLAFLSSAALELLATLSVALVAVTVGLRLAAGDLDLQTGLVAILLAPEAYWPIRRVGAEFHAAADGVQALDEVLEELEKDPSCPSEVLGTPGSRIQLQDVSYRYPGADREALHHVSLITTGGLVVVTGPSGSGKTTLLELMAGLRTPTTGTVEVGPAHLVTQRPFLVPDTVRANLELACRRQPTPAQAWAALAEVGLEDTVAALPAGLDTTVGDDGFGLSAGQRARLAIARALLSDAPVVLLDEPTAHLDSVAAHVVHGALRALATVRTVVVVTHRPELVELADEHVVLGRLAGGAVVIYAALLGAAATMAGIALTATSGWLVVRAGEQPAVLTLLTAVVAVRTFGLARPALRYAERLRSHDVSLRALASQRVEAYRRLVPLTPARLGRRRRADVLAGVVDDLTDVVEAQVRVTVPLVSAFSAGVAAAGLAAVVAPSVGLVLSGLVAALAVLSALAVRWESKAQDAALGARAELLRISELVAGQGIELRAAQAEPAALRWLESARSASVAAVRRQSRGRAATAAGILVLVGAATVLVAAQTASLDVPAPVKGLLALTPVAVVDAFQPLVDAVRAAARVRAASRRLTAILDAQPAVVDGPHTRPLSPGRSVRLQLDAARAAWDGRSTSAGPVDVTIRPGARLLVTGPNGSGKSTLMAVLARQLELTGGRYTVDGTDVSQLPVEEVRALFAVVDDEPHVFATSLRENLRLARSGPVSDDVLVRALADAGLATWFADLVDGLDTRLGSGGRGVSGGERTRLAVARALLSERPVLLLDEPLAHLDHPTAQAVLDDVLAAAGPRSIVLVSHTAARDDRFDAVLELASDHTHSGPKVPDAQPFSAGESTCRQPTTHSIGEDHEHAISSQHTIDA